MQKTGEYNSNNAFIYNGNTGNVNNNNKYNTNAVRPVSEFQGNVDPFASFYKSMRAAYRLCLKNKAHTANAIRFWLDEESELVALAREVFNCEYVPRQSIAFIVTKPCLREVVAADFRDRIVQHYIVMRLEALFEECGTLDDNMFSCRVGKGNLAAIQALQQQIFHQSKGYTTDCYVAKFDLQSFFMSIDKRRLYDELVALVAKRYEGWDKDTLLYLIRVVTLHNPQDNAVRKTPLCDWADLPRSKSLYNVDWFLGLAIGNLTSQSDANFYNAPAMRWMRSVGLAPVNYVDDFAFVVRDKASFLTAMPYIRNYFAAERGLTMHPRKFYLQHYSKGIKFLGAVIKYNRVYTNNQTVARCFGKIHYYNEACRHSSRRKARHVEKLATILNSYLGLMRHFDTFNIRKRIAAEVGTVWCDYIRFRRRHHDGNGRQTFPATGNLQIQRPQTTQTRFIHTQKLTQRWKHSSKLTNYSRASWNCARSWHRRTNGPRNASKTERRFVKHTPTISPDTRPQTPNTTETNRRWPNSKRREKRNEPRKSRRIISTPYEPIDRTIDNGRNHRAKLDDSNIDVDFLSSSCGFDHLVGRCGCGYRLRSLFRLRSGPKKG